MALNPFLKFASNPVLTGLTGLAAVTAPFAMRTENRGYFKTAAITTPLILAAGIAAPSFISSAASAISEHVRFTGRAFSKLAQAGSMDYKTLRQFLETGNIGSSAYDAASEFLPAAAIDWLGQFGRPAAKTLTQRLTDITTLLNNMATNELWEENKWLLTHAFERSRLRTTPPAALAGADLTIAGTPLGREELFQRLRQAELNKNEYFLEVLEGQLRYGGMLRDLGPMTDIAAQAIQAMPPETFGVKDLIGGVSPLDLLRSQKREKVYEALMARQNLLDTATFVATDVATTPKLIRINLRLPGGDLAIPILDPTTGVVHVGADYRIASGRGVWEPVGDTKTVRMALDEWIASHLDRPFADLQSALDIAPVGSIDKLNAYKYESMAADRAAVLTPGATKRYSMEYIPAPGKVFPGNRTYEDLTQAERMTYARSALADWASPITAEHPFLGGTFGARELEFYTAGRMAPWSRQSEAMRAFNKPLHYGYVPLELRPRFTTAAMAGEASVRHTFAMISPQEAELFGGLPLSTGGLAGGKGAAIGRLRFEHPNLTEAQASQLWDTLVREQLSNPDVLQAARLAGGLGETEAILRPGQATRIPTIKNRWIPLNTVNIPFNTPYGPNQVIGWGDIERVVSEADETRLLKLERSISGQLQALVEETYFSRTGDKLNVGGVKATTIQPTAEDFEALRQVVNLKRRMLGETEIPEDATALINEMFFHEKIHEPAGLLAEQAASLYEEAKALQTEFPFDPALTEAMTAFREGMAAQKISYTGAGFEEDTAALAGWLREDLNTRQARILDLAEGLAKNLEIYAGAHRGRIMKHGGVLKGFLNAKNEQSLLRYTLFHHLEAGTAKWNAQGLYMPKRTGVTWEFYSRLYESGLIESMRTVFGRVNFLHGEIRPMADLARYFGAGDYTKVFGERVFSMAEAVPSGFSMKGLTGRVGLFDYTDPRFRNPFSIRLDRPIDVEMGRQMVKHEYIPVLGWGTYGGGPNIEGPGQFYATAYEKALNRLIAASKGTGVGYGEAWRAYQDAIAKAAFGKEGAVWRATTFDPMAISATSEQIAKLEGRSPFEIFVSEEIAEGFGPEVRAAMRKEGVYGIITRHPEQATLPILVRVPARNSAEIALLGKRGIGISKQLAGALEADFDADTLNLFLMSPRDRPAIAELRAAIEEPTSFANQYLNTINLMYANAEASATHRMSTIRGEGSPWEYLLGKVGKEAGNVETAASRLSGRFIGHFANLVYASQTMLRSHPAFMIDPKERAFLSNVLWLPKQAAIGAVKSTQAVGTQTAVETIFERMRAGLGMGTKVGAEQYISGLQEIAKGWKWEAALTPETAAQLFGVSEQELAESIGMGTVGNLRQAMRDQRHFNIVQQVVGSERVRRDLETLIQHPYGQQARNVTHLLMTPSERITTEAFQEFRRIGNVAPELQALAGEQRGIRDVVAGILGAWNRETAAARGAVGKAFKSTLPILGLGLGAAALAGVFVGGGMGEKSASAYRPEMALGTTDNVPGEPIAGLMAPVRPPRRIIPGPPMTRTAVIAPMRQSVDLEVRSPSGDRERAAELSRVVSQVAGGGITFSNINYVNGHKRLSTLRMRQKVHEMLGEE
jgi:hypothetical protein